MNSSNLGSSDLTAESHAEALTIREALELVRDCSSQEWQQPDGKRMSATDNQGRRFWFISDDVMRAVMDALVA